MISIRRPMAAASWLLICSVVSAQQSFHLQSAPARPLVGGQPTDMSWAEIPEEMSHTVESYSDRTDGSDELVEVYVDPPCANCQCGKQRCHGVCTDPGWPRKPIINKPGDRDRDRGDCPPKRYCMPDCKRAGNPHCVAPWARCSVNEKYSSWFVGGGSPFARGRCRKPTEGTWGLDYGGFFGHAKVWLNYTRYDRPQGGEGAYATDGEPAIVSKVHSLIEH